MLSLLKAASVLAGAPVDRAVAMACVVTGSDGPTPISRGHSGLNHDGAPLQLCVSIDRDGARYRLLGDPAADIPDIVHRLKRSLIAAEALLPLSGAQALEPLVKATLAGLIGDENGFDPARHPDGVLWLAGPLQGAGLALYVDARNGGRSAVDRLRAWLASTVEVTEDSEALLAAVAAGRVMSAGLEGLAPGYARAKIYWRMAGAAALAESPIALFADPAFARTAAEVIGDRDIRLDGLVLNAGLSIPDGRLVDAKLDICCCPHCVRLEPAEAVLLAHRLAMFHDLPMPDIAALTTAGELAFIGFGLTRKREPRLNFYFKPKLGDVDHGSNNRQ